MKIKSEKTIQPEWIDPRETSKATTLGMTKRCSGISSRGASGTHEQRKAAKFFEYEYERRRAQAMMFLHRNQNWMR